MAAQQTGLQVEVNEADLVGTDMVMVERDPVVQPKWVKQFHPLRLGIRLLANTVIGDIAIPQVACCRTSGAVADAKDRSVAGNSS